MKVPKCPDCGFHHWLLGRERCGKHGVDWVGDEPTPDEPVRSEKKVVERKSAPTVSPELVPGEPCPTCGKPVGMSAAERKRRERERKKGGKK